MSQADDWQAACSAGQEDVVLRILSGMSSSRQVPFAKLQSAFDSGFEQVVTKILSNAQPTALKSYLKMACRQGSEGLLTEMLSESYDIRHSLPQNEKDAALHIAVQKTSCKAVEALLLAGAKADCVSDKGELPLLRASREGKVEIVEVLLEHEATLGMQDAKGYSALLKACITGQLEVAQLLLNHANGRSLVNMDNDAGWSPLMVAAAEGYLELVNFLVDGWGANVNASNKMGITALMAACLSDKSGYGEKRSTQNYDLDTLPLIPADSFWENPSNPQLRAGIMRALLDRGADATLQCDNGWNALHMAIKGSHTQCVEILLNHGVGTLADTPEGGKLLHLACHHSSPVADLLLKRPVNLDHLNTWDFEGKTPLHWAVSIPYRASKGVVDKLLEAEADQTMKTRDGETIQQLALRGRTASVMLLFLRTQDQKEQALIRAAENGDTELVENLIRCGVDKNAVQEDKRPLWAAAAHGHAATVKMLLEKLEEPADRTLKDHGWSALHFAAYHRHPGAVDVLLKEAGDDEINAQTSEGDTPLMLAVCFDESPSPSIVKALLNKGARMDLPNHQGLNAITEAVEAGNAVILQILRGHASYNCNLEDDSKGTNAMRRAETEVHTANVTPMSQGEDSTSRKRRRESLRFEETNTFHRELRGLDDGAQSPDWWRRHLESLARHLQCHGLQVPTERMQQDAYMGAARYRGLEKYMHDKGWLQISTKQVRDWLRDSGNFPESYSSHQLRLEDCDIDHILPRHLGGVDHPFNYYILPREVNRLWNGWWTLHKRTYMGRTNYANFKRFIVWHREEVARRQIRLYDFE